MVIFQVEKAKHIARIIFDTFDQDKDGYLNIDECKNFINDSAKCISKVPSFTKEDLDLLVKILDKNSDGKVSYSDVQALSIKYLCGDVTPIRKLTKITQQRLDILRKQFKKINEDGSGFISDKDVLNLLNQSFKLMKINHPLTLDQIKTIVIINDKGKSCDLVDDGIFLLEQLQEIVLKLFATDGTKVYQN